MRLRNEFVMTALVMLTACATHPPAAIPEALLLPCPEPVGSVGTNGLLAEYARQAVEALRSCNRDKEALRESAGS